MVEFYEVQVELLTDTVVSSVETSCSVSTGCVAQFTKDLQSTNTQRPTKHTNTKDLQSTNTQQQQIKKQK